MCKSCIACYTHQWTVNLQAGAANTAVESSSTTATLNIFGSSYSYIPLVGIEIEVCSPLSIDVANDEVFQNRGLYIAIPAYNEQQLLLIQ